MSVYFATCRDAGAVKIGSSVDPHGRLSEIQTGCPMRITIEAVLPGTCEEEFTFHRRFADDNIQGEWFVLTPLIEAIIANNPAPQPRPKRTRQALIDARHRRAKDLAQRQLRREGKRRIKFAGAELARVKKSRRLTLEDMGGAIGCSREMIAQYIAGEAEMGMTKWLRARETWPEMIDKWNELRPKRAA